MEKTYRHLVVKVHKALRKAFPSNVPPEIEERIRASIVFTLDSK